MVSCNSSYYFSLNNIKPIVDLLHSIITIGHRSHHNMKVNEIVDVIQSCSNVHFGAAKIRMSINGTSDSYEHSTSQLLDVARHTFSLTEHDHFEMC